MAGTRLGMAAQRGTPSLLNSEDTPFLFASLVLDGPRDTPAELNFLSHLCLQVSWSHL